MSGKKGRYLGQNKPLLKNSGILWSYISYQSGLTYI